MNEKEINRIIEKSRKKIAISQFKKEDTVNSKFNIKKIVATFVVSLSVTMGVVYAGGLVYENVWKEPVRVDFSNNEITEEVIEKNVTEEEAMEIAKNKLIELGIEDTEIIETEHYKLSTDDEIYYTFITNDWSIIILGKNGRFYRLANKNYDKDVENYGMKRDEAITVAKEIYKELGYKDGEYKFYKLSPRGIDEDNACEYAAMFCKKYDDLYNTYESVHLSFDAKDKKLNSYEVQEGKFENNPVEISKEKAIEIATNEDRKVETKPIISTEAELKIKKMNGEAYARANNTEAYYKPVLTPDVPSEEQVYYKTEDRIRRAWIVSFNYDMSGEDVVTTYGKGFYTYYIDATTGEIIGGTRSDEAHWEDFWYEKYKVDE